MNIKNLSTKYFGTNQALSLYLNEIRKYEVPTQEEEKELFEKIKNGDNNARNEIIVRNQRFVYAIAKVYAKDENDVLEYVSEGNIGLMQAIDEYDQEKGTRFLTFAVWYIRRSMNYYLSNTSNMVVRSNNMKLSKKIDSVKEDYFNEYGIYPSEKEIIEMIKDKFNINIKETSDVYDVNVSSINEELDDDYTVEDNSLFNEKTASYNTYENDVDSEYSNSVISEILGSLPDKTADIVKMLFGIGYDRVYNADEVGEKYNMYPEDVNAIKNKAIKFLKQTHKFKRAI